MLFPSVLVPFFGIFATVSAQLYPGELADSLYLNNLQEFGPHNEPYLTGEETQNPNAVNNQAESYLEQPFEQNQENDVPVHELPGHVGHIGGLAVDPNNHLVIFHRSGRVWDEHSFDQNNVFNKSLGPIHNATITVIEPQTGKLSGEYGTNEFYMPHGLTADSEGNFFVTDVGSHQVIKLDKDFKPVLVLGEKLVPGSDDKHFCKPTDVAVAKNGEFFVADGYCNSRIMKFSKDGKLIAKFGHANTEMPGKAGEFWVPHSLALVEEMNMICVADRENERIQCFTAGLHGQQHPRSMAPTGSFVTKAEGIGRVYAIREEKHYMIGAVNNEDADGRPDPTKPSIFIMDLETGRASTMGEGLVNAHALAVTKTGDVYVAQLYPSQIVRISLSPGGQVAEEASA